jgi:hypothetical protein
MMVEGGGARTCLRCCPRSALLRSQGRLVPGGHLRLSAYLSHRTTANSQQKGGKANIEQYGGDRCNA